MDTLEAQSKRAAMILHAAFDDIERAGIDATAVSLALITMGAEGLTIMARQNGDGEWECRLKIGVCSRRCR